VFYLRATVQVGTNTVERTLSTTVTVRVPDLRTAKAYRQDFVAIAKLDSQ
jgi:hypothetical protein